MRFSRLSHRLILGGWLLVPSALCAQVPPASPPPPVVNLAPRPDLPQLPDDLAARDWAVAAQPSLRVAPPSRDAIAAFVGRRLRPWDNGPGPHGHALCAAGFYDIAPDGQYRLAVIMNRPGHKLCDDLLVMGKIGGTLSLKIRELADQDALDGFMRPAGPSSPALMIVPELWQASSGPGDCAAFWTRIFQATATGFTDVSARHPDIYRARLVNLATDIAHLPSGKQQDPLIASCPIMERDRITRFLGGQPDAGLGQALAWAQSHDWRLRRNAVAVLATIAAPRAHDTLLRLARDQNRAVAVAAKMSLKAH